MYVDDVKDGMRTRAHCPPSPHFAPSELRGGTATTKPFNFGYNTVMAPFDGKDLHNARELLGEKRGPEDLLNELTTLVQNGGIERTDVPEIITSLQKTVEALKKILKPKTSESATASEWVKTIKDDGVAFISGKLNPFWFDESDTPKPIHDPGYSSHGAINTNLSGGGEMPNGKATDKIAQFSAAVIQNNRDTGYLIMSREIDPHFNEDLELSREFSRLVREGVQSKDMPLKIRSNHQNAEFSKYSSNNLGPKIRNKYRQVSFMFWTDAQQPLVGDPAIPMLSWRGERGDKSYDRPLQATLNIFLPSEQAESIFSEMQEHPKYLLELVATLYPKTKSEQYPLKTSDVKLLHTISDFDSITAKVLDSMRSPKKVIEVD